MAKALRAAGLAVLGVCVLAALLATVGGARWPRAAALMEVEVQPSPVRMTAAGEPGPMRKGALVQMDVPATQLATTKIGDIVHGKMKAAGGEVAFTGAIAAGTQMSQTQGAVTIRVMSDKYIQPGTPVSGRVGNSMFKGTVTQSPNVQERLADMEKRLAQLEVPAKQPIIDMHKTLQDYDSRLRTLEGSQTMEERVDELERKITALENQKPGLDWRKIKYNREGFHFHGSIGPNNLEPSLDKVEENLSDIEKGPEPEEVVEPVATRLEEVEARINEIADEIKPKDKMAKLEKRLAALEKQAMDDDEKP
jgi:polyhydroxyalkanoate synthesis regulator phasin